MIMRYKLAVLLALLLVPVGLALAATTDRAVPGDSAYTIPALSLRDQAGHVFDFASLRGVPRLVGMFYGSCRMACPLEIEYLKNLQHAVMVKTGKNVPVLLVSFDPSNDDLEVLKKVAAMHHVNAPVFTLARPEHGDEGMLAGVLDIAYRKLPGGGFSHNVRVSLLDAQGRIVASTDASGTPDQAFVRAIVVQQNPR